MKFLSFLHFTILALPFATAIIDPISLSVVSFAVFSYMGMNSAIIATLLAGAGTAGIGGLKVLNDLLIKHNYEPVKADEKVTLLCFHDDVSFDISGDFCEAYLRNAGYCKNTSEKFEKVFGGFNMKTCGIAKTSMNTTITKRTHSTKYSYECIVRRKPFSEIELNYITKKQSNCKHALDQLKNNSEGTFNQ